MTNKTLGGENNLENWMKKSCCTTTMSEMSSGLKYTNTDF